MKPKLNVKTPSIRYDDEKLAQFIGGGYLSFFTMQTEYSCFPDSCSLMEESCMNAINQTDVIIGTKSPFVIQAKTNNAKGYGYRFCVECRIDGNKFFYKPLVIVAKKKGKGWSRPKEKKVYAYIKSVNSLGLMNIEFSRNMNVTKVIDQLNDTYVDIFITPYVYEDQPRNVNLTWNITSFDNQTLLVQLDFENPLLISSSLRYDTITFDVINQTDIFVSTEGLKLDTDSKTLSSKINKQMINNKGTRQFVATSMTTRSII